MTKHAIVLLAALLSVLMSPAVRAASACGPDFFSGRGGLGCGLYLSDAPVPPVAASLPARGGYAAPLFPEDGSVTMKAWYTSPSQGHPSAALRAALAAEGVELRDIGFKYEWAQDIALFSGGGLLLQAEAPLRLLDQLHLSMGVLNDEDGYLRLTSLSEADAAALGVPARRMKYTFVEGGELISGSFADGAPYAIIGQSPVLGAQLIYEHRTGEKISPDRAAGLVAEDLGVPPGNLFVVPSFGHLDLVITPLPGGTLLLSDPSGTARAIEDALAKTEREEEKARLESQLKLYKEGWQPVYAGGSEPMGERQYPFAKHHQEILDRAAAILSSRFRVIRAPGVFRELRPYAGSTGHYMADNINFFNGFTGVNAEGEVFQVTNAAEGLPSLEQYWRELLAGLGVSRVHFPGRYAIGAGLDCMGAPAGDMTSPL